MMSTSLNNVIVENCSAVYSIPEFYLCFICVLAAMLLYDHL